jgi:AcrR family transcriptional regulator
MASQQKKSQIETYGETEIPTLLTTKERILRASVELFNAHGVEAVTVRHIAQRLGISHGNLCYHFPRKEDIIIALYQRIVDGMSSQIIQADEVLPSVGFVMEAIRASFVLQYEYRFLMIDFVNILRRIPEIGGDFRRIFHLRCEQVGMLLFALQQEGLLLRSISDEQYKNLVRHVYMFGNFWLSEGEITYEGEEQNKLRFFVELGWSLLVPYLTSKGLEEYEAYREAAWY